MSPGVLRLGFLLKPVEETYDWRGPAVNARRVTSRTTTGHQLNH